MQVTEGWLTGGLYDDTLADTDALLLHVGSLAAAPPCGRRPAFAPLSLRPSQPPPLSASAPLSLAPVPRLAGAVAPYGTTGREWQGRFL